MPKAKIIPSTKVFIENANATLSCSVENMNDYYDEYSTFWLDGNENLLKIVS
jgi:hypothetical protein